MFRVAVTATIILFSLPSFYKQAAAEPIAEIADDQLVDLLNYMEVIAERSSITERTLFGSIRLVRVQSLGECDGTPESCPTQKLYVAVSGWDEYPDRKVYELPAAHGWDFKEWVRVPDAESVDDYYVFIVEKTVVAADISTGWWSTERYQVEANTHGATLSKLP